MPRTGKKAQASQLGIETSVLCICRSLFNHISPYLYKPEEILGWEQAGPWLLTCLQVFMPAAEAFMEFLVPAGQAVLPLAETS